jgi:hypothetical protein
MHQKDLEQMIGILQLLNIMGTGDGNFTGFMYGEI